MNQNDNKEWRITTAERFAQLVQERNDIVAHVAKQSLVGGSIQVEVTPEFQSEHSTGRFGRMEFGEGEKAQLSLAPAVIDRTLRMQIPDVRNGSWGEQISYGLRVATPAVDWPVPRLPEPLRAVNSNRSRKRIEWALFSRLLSLGHVITLVNPSFSSMASLQTLTTGGFVTLSSGEDQEFASRIKDFIKKGGDRLTMLSPRVSNGIAYLGEGNFKWVPDVSFRLVQSPYFNWSHEGPSQVVFEGGRYTVRTQKKYDSFPVPFRSEFDYRPGTFVSNPVSVDVFCQTFERRYFVQSDIDLGIIDHPSIQVNVHPQMTPYLGSWKEIDGREWLVDGLIVSDWRPIGRAPRGVYFMRRLVSPPIGYRWDSLGTGLVFNSATTIPRQNEFLKTVIKPGMTAVLPQHHHMVTSIGMTSIVDSEVFVVTQEDGSVLHLEGEQTMIPFVHRKGEQVHDLLNAIHSADFVSAIQSENQVYYVFDKQGSFFFLDKLSDMNRYAIHFLSVPDTSSVSGSSLDPDGTIKWASGAGSQQAIHYPLQEEVKTWRDGGISMGLWSRSTEFTIAYLRGYMLRVHSVHYWKDLSHVVSEEYLYVRLDGDPSSDDFWDGRLLSQCLESLLHGNTDFPLRIYPSVDLLHFFRLNSGHVEVISCNGWYILRVLNWKKKD